MKLVKPKFSDKEMEKIKAIANEMQEKIESSFLDESNEAKIAEVKALRKSLEEMGIAVTIKYNLDAVALKLHAEVTLWQAKVLN